MYRKDAKGKEEVFLDPNTFLKTELPLGGIDFSKMVQKPSSEGGRLKVIIMDAYQKK
jgi:prolyl oligopeptidase